MSDALPLSSFTSPSALPHEARSAASQPARASGAAPRMPLLRLAPMPALPRPPAPPIPRTTPERMAVARDRIRDAALAGQRIRSYEVALDLDLSEFHFARQFRAAFGRSPHVFYDEVRAARTRELLGEGHGEGEVARRVGFRRPAELRALLTKRSG